MLDVAQTWGLVRSLLMYYRPGQIHRLRRLYRGFIRPGDLCFDIGAHAGNRVRAWLGLGARVLAIEPQPLFANLLRRWYGNNPRVTVLQKAVGARPGRATMLISHRTPTLSTLSQDWAARVAAEPSFAGVRWDADQDVEVTTLDRLVADWGLPAFCKIDVEGYESQVLAGLTVPLPQLSFEVIPVVREQALACIERLEALGPYHYNVALGEAGRLVWPAFADAETIKQWLHDMAPGARSGDVYARLLKGQVAGWIGSRYTVAQVAHPYAFPTPGVPVHESFFTSPARCPLRPHHSPDASLAGRDFFWRYAWQTVRFEQPYVFDLIGCFLVRPAKRSEPARTLRFDRLRRRHYHRLISRSMETPSAVSRD